MKIRQVVQKIRNEKAGWEERFQCGGRIEERRQAFREATAWAYNKTCVVKERIEEVRTSWIRTWESWHAEPAPESIQLNYFETKASDSANVGGWFFLCLEVLLGLLISWRLVRAGLVVAAGIGTTISFILAYASKGLMAPLFLAQWASHPKGGLRAMLRLLKVLGPLEFIFLLGLALVRGSGGGRIFELIWWLCPCYLALATPLLAGSLFVVSTLLGSFRDHHNDYVLLNEILKDLETFSDLCLQGMSSPTINLQDSPGKRGNETAAENSPAKPPRKVELSRAGEIVATALIAALAFVLFRSPAFAQQRAECNGRAIGQIFFDISSSVPMGTLSAAQSQIRDELLSRSSQLNVCQWQFIAFFEDGFEAPAFYTSPILPAWSTKQACPPIEHSELGTLFNTVAEKEDQQAAEKCAAKQRNDLDNLNRIMTQVATALTQPLPQKLGRCTALVDVLDRLRGSARPLRSVIITDGYDNCLNSATRLAPPENDVEVIVALIPTKQRPSARSQAAEFRARERHLLEIAPWITITSLPNLSFEDFKDIRKMPRSGQPSNKALVNAPLQSGSRTAN